MNQISDTSRGRSGDLQESVGRGVWGEREDATDGSYMSVRGTGREDARVPVMNFGYSFNLPANSNAEVITLSIGSNPWDKVALPVLPRDLQYQWPQGTGGIQSPNNPERRMEFNENETFLRDGTFVVGSNREVTITVDGSNVTVQTAGDVNVNATGSANVSAQGDMTLTAQGALRLTASGVNIDSATLTHNGTNIGDTHTHGGVDTGAGNTAGPNP